jgi:hypothetical protein
MIMEGRHFRLGLAFFALLLLLHGRAWAQGPATPAGVVTGRLVSVEGKPAVGIRVAAVAVSSSNSVHSDAAIMVLAQADNGGRYRLEGVPPGSYYIMAGHLDSPSYYPVSRISPSRLL